jgi:hypothetical protein
MNHYAKMLKVLDLRLMHFFLTSVSDAKITFPLRKPDDVTINVAF